MEGWCDLEGLGRGRSGMIQGWAKGSRCGLGWGRRFWICGEGERCRDLVSGHNKDFIEIGSLNNKYGSENSCSQLLQAYRGYSSQIALFISFQWPSLSPYYVFFFWCFPIFQFWIIEKQGLFIFGLKQKASNSKGLHSGIMFCYVHICENNLFSKIHRVQNFLESMTVMQHKRDYFLTQLIRRHPYQKIKGKQNVSKKRRQVVLFILLKYFLLEDIYNKKTRYYNFLLIYHLFYILNFNI